jgi:hypothetical protein
MKISESQFREALDSGIDLKNPRLQTAAKHAGVSKSDIGALDQNRDKKLTGEELTDLHQLLDLVDTHDDGVDLGYRDDNTIGKDTVLFHGIVDSIIDPRERIVAVARASQMDPRLDEGYRGSERMVSHNTIHGGTRNGDLITTRFENTYKCNLFVGDVLWRSGLKIPTLSNEAAGWTHIQYAESWARSPLFKTVPKEDLKPGDVLLVDYPETGSGGGHLEIVTEVKNDVRTIGSRWGENAINEDSSRARLLENAVEVKPGVYQDESGTQFRILRHRDLENRNGSLRI